MKVGDLVKEQYGLERVGLVLSGIRRSTPQDNYQMGVMYGDNHRVVDVFVFEAGAKAVCDIDGVEVISESR
jgi:hypothetical protein